ncbi:S-adenosyl-L-methionine-dependent methyltransferase [Xylaria bambusicola]|uniref:S-adenosyl-L-methionine-dependent methyltransferase n=1 Tax=Xylaria bambusicola TaxID=326684 RepID=UPI00200755D8|nr:S-adenosyl-L-methionine-dependent methyltransferase [Xylaria bambusicola]KAI0512934.1 S-adenosyl-L-methionine-dependent methyltransferase [Xylaria bambusicola]
MTTQLDDPLHQLQQLGNLIQSSIADYVKLKQESVENAESKLPEKSLFDAQRTLLAAAGLLTELVSQPQNRLLEVSSQYFEARALHIVADKRIPDILAQSGDAGVAIISLSSAVGIEPRKLSRIMRCLCSIHVFHEKGEDVFINNRISSSLVGNEPLRAYIMLFGLDLYSSSDYLPRYLSDPVKGPSYALEVTPWQDALKTSKPRWDWLEESVPIHDLEAGNNSSDGGSSAYPGVFGDELAKACDGKTSATLIKRPEHRIFGLAMVGGGRVFGAAHLYDFPWATLGSATVVDVGGGVGGFCLQLSHIYPDLQFVVQDRAPALQQAQTEVWPRENAEALTAGRVKFMPHDFFDVNPVKNADVYWLRYILHDWSDDYCVRILNAIKPSMGPRSRILICDQVMNTTRGCAELPAAPAPLPANWGYYTRYSHQRDLAMMSIINGIERKPTEFKDLVDRAGLRLRKIWDCRSQVGLVEIVLPGSKLD